MTGLVVTGFMLGLLGSGHCLGMCGPIALAVPSRRSTPQGKLLDALLLNSGRVLSYVLLGGLVGTFGRGIQLMGLQRGISIGLGLVVIVILLRPGVGRALDVLPWLARRIGRMRSFFARQLVRTSPGALMISGSLNGLLPCGMVYMALAISLVQGSALLGAIFMLLFGMGTWPMLIGVRLGAGAIGARPRAMLQRLSPVIMGLMAVLFLLRGLGLGIPYVSPSIEQIPLGVQACR